MHIFGVYDVQSKAIIVQKFMYHIQKKKKIVLLTFTIIWTLLVWMMFTPKPLLCKNIPQFEEKIGIAYFHNNMPIENPYKIVQPKRGHL